MLTEEEKRGYNPTDKRTISSAIFGGLSMEKVKDKNSDIKPVFVPDICPKCKRGKLESQCDGRVYICNNPSCRAGMWLKLKNKN